MTAIDSRVTQLKNEATVLFDIPELQKLRVRPSTQPFLF